MEKGAKTTTTVEVAEHATGLPERKYFRIGEVAEIVGVEPHVLRYWETQFSQLRPHKARSGHRLYRRREVETLLVIKDLLHVQRFTIAGARQALRQGASSTLPRVAEQLTLPPTAAVTARHTRVLESTLPQDAEDEEGAEAGEDPALADDELLDDGSEDDVDVGDGADVDGQDGQDDGEADDDHDAADDDEEMELHLAGPLPAPAHQTRIVVEARDGDELAAAMAAEVAARHDGGYVAVDLRATPAAATTRRARRLLGQAVTDLEHLIAGLRRR
jgi:DNA-binding transcriptional MerR regulator